MDSNARIKLIKEEITRGNFGQEIIEETSTEVYANINSITRAEWTAAGQSGINAEFRVDVYSFEYHGERVVELDGMRYGVYRAYPRVNKDITELYLHTVAGVTYSDDDFDEIDIPVYIEVYEALSRTGIPVFYGNASEGQNLPYITYTLDSNNFEADDSVYVNGYRLTATLYTGRKSLKRERLVESALNGAEIPWERTESEEINERLYMQAYEGEVLGGE